MKSIVIKNYKNIKDLSIDSLAPVNLIVGRNNVGKSTLLEAISIYAAGGNIEWLKELLKFRGESVEIKSPFDDTDIELEKIMMEHFLSFFPERKPIYSEGKSIIIKEKENNASSKKVLSIRMVYIEDVTVTGETGRVNRQVVIELTPEQILADDITTPNLAGRGLEITFAGETTIVPFYKRNRYAITKMKGIPFEYVRTYDFQTTQNASLFDKISLSAEEKYIVEALHIIDPDIEKLNFLNDDLQKRRIPYVTLKGKEKRHRLSSMGDGINRVLTIILALLNCKGGILLLDEFETGLHHSIQIRLWKIIFMLSEKLNIQVFVTSHSQDCINSFVEANNKQKGKLIRLENRNGNVVAVNYDDEKELRFATDNNIEIR